MLVFNHLVKHARTCTRTRFFWTMNNVCRLILNNRCYKFNNDDLSWTQYQTYRIESDSVRFNNVLTHIFKSLITRTLSMSIQCYITLIGLIVLIAPLANSTDMTDEFGIFAARFQWRIIKFNVRPIIINNHNNNYFYYYRQLNNHQITEEHFSDFAWSLNARNTSHIKPDNIQVHQ